jgi:hypothetical protein
LGYNGRPDSDVSIGVSVNGATMEIVPEVEIISTHSRGLIGSEFKSPYVIITGAVFVIRAALFAFSKKRSSK